MAAISPATSPANASAAAADVVELKVTDGVAFIEQGSPLTRLHYFDGKFLRADALAAEQDYHRTRVHLANQAGGWGVVHGLGIAREGAMLVVQPGLAVTPAGRFVLATGPLRAPLADLLRLQRPTSEMKGSEAFADCLHKGPATGVAETAAPAVYALTAGPVEGLCGQEAVYGKLCDSACATDSRHPWWREGVVLRLRRLNLVLPVPRALVPGDAHWRNRVASAYFGAEPGAVASALSGAGLAGPVWCGTAGLDLREEVVLGLLLRQGEAATLLDAWAGRRERMDTQARAHWQGRMAMRPWNVFIAQMLQFQCQLSERLEVGGARFKEDDCGRIRALLERTRRELDAVTERWRKSAAEVLDPAGGGAGGIKTGPTARQIKSLGTGMQASFAEIGSLAADLAVLDGAQGALPVQRMLIEAGFLDLPPAGYLPVVPGQAPLQVQLQRMFGEGVRLQLHAVRADEIGHLVEQAQHLGRISLTRGLDDAAALEDVEVFVPDGRSRAAQAPAAGTWWRLQAGRELTALAGLPGAGDTQDVRWGQDQDAEKLRSMVPYRDIGKTTGKDLGRDGEADGPAEGDDTSPGSGLARTWARDGGGWAAAAVLIPEGLEQDLPDDDFGDLSGDAPRDAKDAAAAAPGMKRRGMTMQPEIVQPTRRGTPAWVAGDIGADPFALAVGDHTALAGELRLAARVWMRRQPLQVVALGALQGRATVLSRTPQAQGGQRLRLQLDLLLDWSVGLAGQPAEPQQLRHRLAVELQRDGDTRRGRILADTAPLDLADGALRLSWTGAADGGPGEALLELVAQVARRVIDANIEIMARAMRQAEAMRKAMARDPSKDQPEAAPAQAEAAVEFQNLPPAAEMPEQPPVYTGKGVLNRVPLLAAEALAAMPGPAHPLGAGALQILAHLADATDDPAFLARARRALLPTLDAPTERRVDGVHDWVMFRRARTPLCAAPCAPVLADTATEALQVWHLALGDDKELPALARALDRGDTTALARYKFRRVGVLRYRDAATEPEDSAARVLALWRAVRPLPQVALGRAWERSPATGQGWQNHFRLRAMLQRIAPLTAPPPRGEGRIGVMPPPPEPLADGALDGGMLVVTVGAEEVPVPTPVSTLHAVLLVDGNTYSAANYDRVVQAAGVDPATAWQAATAMLPNSQTLFMRFVDGVPDASDVMKLDAAHAMMIGGGASGEWPLRVLRVDANPGLTGPAGGAQHTVVLQRLAVGGVLTDDGSFRAPVPDLGQGATVLTLAYYIRIG